MNSQFFARFPRWSRRLESIARVVAGNIPFTVGIVLRRWIYRGLFKRFGTQITIYPGVEFVGANHIELGDYVNLESNVRLNCSGQSEMQLDPGIRFEQDIALTGEKKNSLIVIGDRTSIGSHCCISGTGSVHIGKNCLIASYVDICSSHYAFTDSSRTISQGNTLESITIEDNCWIGSGAKILAGVTLGQGCVIEAGAVVTKDVPSYSVAAGVPAQVVTQRCNTLTSKQSLRK